MANTVTTQLVNHGERRDRKGRQWVPRERREQLLAAFRESGLAQVAFAEREGTLQKRVLPKSGLCQACAYLLGHWALLTAHLRHSQTRLDTNVVENAIRRANSARRTGSSWGVQPPEIAPPSSTRWSSVASATVTNHHAYLRDVLTRLPAMTIKDDLRPLLPAH